MSIINLRYNSPNGWGGWWWQPWANTVLYCPFTSNLTDQISWNNLSGTVTYGTIWWSTINCALNSSAITWTWANLPQSTSARTMSMWVYYDSSDQWEAWIMSYWIGGTNNQIFAVVAYFWEYMLSQWWSNSWFHWTITPWAWYQITMTYNTNNEWKLYANGTLVYTWNYTIGTVGNNIALWDLVWNPWNQKLYWGFSNLIIENVERTAQEVLDYYDQTKSLYGIS